MLDDGVSQLIKYPHNESQFDCDVFAFREWFLKL